MNFLSLEFVFFFILVFFLIRNRSSAVRSFALLSASYFFYWTFSPIYFLLLFILTITDYISAIWIEKTDKKKIKKIVFLFVLLTNVGVLAFFKYFNFFNDTVKSIFKVFKVTYTVSPVTILVPIGISYYIFKKISYLTDVYRGTIKAERNFVYLALFVSFFPEIISGPIDRAKPLIEQFKSNVIVNIPMVVEGLQMIGWGLFKKLVIADRVAMLINSVYAKPDKFNGLVIILSLVFYSFQIYCDFSGYSDMAIGMGRILGIRLADNFKQPYFSKSLAEFWKRWHITLSLWLRDYIFLPTSYSLMNRFDRSKLFFKKIKNVEIWAYIIGTMLTMLVCGLWHGARWTFVVWGGAHGLILSISLVSRKLRRKIVKKLKLKKLPKTRVFLQIFSTFFSVTILWVFFRAETMSKAINILKKVFVSDLSLPIFINGHIGKMSQPDLYIVFIAIFMLLIIEYLFEKKNVFSSLNNLPVYLRWGIYFFFIFTILLFGVYKKTEFIYGSF